MDLTEIWTHQISGGRKEGVSLGTDGWASIEGGPFVKRKARARLIEAAPGLMILLKRGLNCGVFDDAPEFKKDVIAAITEAERDT